MKNKRIPIILSAFILSFLTVNTCHAQLGYVVFGNGNMCSGSGICTASNIDPSPVQVTRSGIKYYIDATPVLFKATNNGGNTFSLTMTIDFGALYANDQYAYNQFYSSTQASQYIFYIWQAGNNEDIPANVINNIAPGNAVDAHIPAQISYYNLGPGGTLNLPQTPTQGQAYFQTISLGNNFQGQEVQPFVSVTTIKKHHHNKNPKKTDDK